MDDSTKLQGNQQYSAFFFQYFILEWNVLISDDMFFFPLYSSTLKKQKQSENDI